MYNVYVDTARIDRLTPSGLAFIGDAVYTLYMRERAITVSDVVVGTLHNTVSQTVNAVAQAKVYDALVLSSALNDIESEIGRRAKNAHLHTKAKAASSEDYHKATALEAIVGYVHLAGDAARERELLELCAVLDEQTKRSI